MLELLHDHRSGQRLEIIIPTFNEERRIGNILRYYSDRFDMVLLDDDSQDQTVPLALAAGATVFRRQGKLIGDIYFAHYANELTRSNLCFYLFADEFIARTDLEVIERELRERVSVVLCQKAEWLYGQRMSTLDHVERRGFRKGCVQYDAEHLHEALKTAPLPPAQIGRQRFRLEHLHLWSIQNLFGKVGLYTYAEVEQFRRSRQPLRRFLRRYLVSLFGFPLTKAWRERGLRLPVAVTFTLVDLAELVIATLSGLEQTCLMSTEAQLAQYARFYQAEPQPVPFKQEKC